MNYKEISDLKIYRWSTEIWSSRKRPWSRKSNTQILVWHWQKLPCSHHTPCIGASLWGTSVVPKTAVGTPALTKPCLHCKMCGGKEMRLFRLKLLMQCPIFWLVSFPMSFPTHNSYFFSHAQDPCLFPSHYQYAVIMFL